MVISIPLGFFAGIGGASKIGVLIKGSNYLETLAKSEILVFDKTGTLTQGSFDVQKIKPVKISDEQLLRIATYCESYSNHPISLSLKNAYGKTIDNSLVSDIKELSGLGIYAKIDGKDALVGNEKLMQQYNIDYIKCDDVGTVLYVALSNQFLGCIVIGDKLKDDALTAIQGLKSLNVKKTVMLTGDVKSVADSVGNQLGIDEVYSELLPTDKAKKLEEIMKSKSENGSVVFVGDGINDSPVLALADVGIAMGALGSDSAIEAADVVVMTDEPSKITNSIKLARKTIKIVKSNIIFALAVKLIVLLLSAFGISTMWEAVFADVGVSILCVLNSLRVL